MLRQGSSDVSVLLGHADGLFDPEFRTALTPSPLAVTAGDIDGDSIPDRAIVTQVPTGQVNVVLGNGDGTFHDLQLLPVGSEPVFATPSRLDSDERADLVVVNRGSSDLSIFIATADGTLGAETRHPAGESPRAVAIADLDLDGHADIAVANESGPVSVLFGQGGGAFGEATDTTFDDPEEPAPRSGFFDLIANVDEAGFESGLGSSSLGVARVPEEACP